MATILVLFVALLSVTLGTYLIIFPRLQEIHLREASNSLVAAGNLLREMDVTDEGRLVRKMSELASRPALQDLLWRRPKKDQARMAWLEKLSVDIAGLSAAAREVAPLQDFFILDAEGVGLVRNIDLHWTGQAPSGNPRVLEAIAVAGGGGQEALIIQEGKNLLRAVTVPVVVKEQVQAIFLATFPLDDVVAKVRRIELSPGLEFAYITKEGIASGALSESASQFLTTFLASGEHQITRLTEGQIFAPRLTQGRVGHWLLMGFPLKAKGGRDLSGLVVVREVNSLIEPYRELALWLFGGGGGCFLLLMIGTLVLGGRLSRGLKRLEADALEIAHGSRSRKFEIQGPVAVRALAELLNQIRQVPRLMKAGRDVGEGREAGRVEEAREFEEKEIKAPPTIPERPSKVEAKSTPHPEPSGPQVDTEAEEEIETGPRAAAAEREPEKQSAEEAEEQPGKSEEEQYYREIYAEFIRAKESIGEKVDKLNFERFMSKLRKQGELLMAKHGCRGVKFLVTVKDNQVTLRPRIIK